MEGANPFLKYPGRGRLTEEDMETFCLATTCLPGQKKPLLPPSVFEHIALLDEVCLFTGRHIRGMKVLAKEVRLMWGFIHGHTVTPQFKADSKFWDIVYNQPNIIDNSRYNMAPVYEMTRLATTAIVLEFFGPSNYGQVLVSYDRWLNPPGHPSGALFSAEEVLALKGQPVHRHLHERLMREKVWRCIDDGKINQTTGCIKRERATKQELMQDVRKLVNIAKNLRLFGGTDLQSFVPQERLPDMANILKQTGGLCEDEGGQIMPGNNAISGGSPPGIIGGIPSSMVKELFCPLDQQSDFSAFTNRELLMVFESAYFAGSDEWRAFFDLNFTQPWFVWNNTQSPECTGHPELTPGKTCFDFTRAAVQLPNVLDAVRTNGSDGQWLRKDNSSHFVLSRRWSVNEEAPLYLSEYCVGLAEDRLKGMVRGQRGSRLNREDNILCALRSALLIDVFQDMFINPFLGYGDKLVPTIPVPTVPTTPVPTTPVPTLPLCQDGVQATSGSSFPRACQVLLVSASVALSWS